MNIELAEDRRRLLDCSDASFAVFIDVNLSVIIFWYMLVVVVLVSAVPFEETPHNEHVTVLLLLRLRGGSVQTAAVVTAVGRREEDRLEDTSPLLTEGN